MGTPVDLFVTSITDSLTRIRSLLFVSLGLCAIVLSNAYLENYSTDDKLMTGAYVFKATFEEERDVQKLKLKDTIIPGARSKLELSISSLQSRIDRLENSLKDYKLRSVTIPVTGVNVPANDLNIVCGIFLACLSLWLLVSANQARTAFRDATMQKELKDYLPALRHTVLLVIPKEKRVLRMVAMLLIMAPAITMTLAMLNDLISILRYDEPNLLIAFIGLVVVRLVFLTAVSCVLWVTSIVVLRTSKDLDAVFYPDSL